MMNRFQCNGGTFNDYANPIKSKSMAIFFQCSVLKEQCPSNEDVERIRLLQCRHIFAENLHEV